jgi:hypothetical protein
MPESMQLLSPNSYMYESEDAAPGELVGDYRAARFPLRQLLVGAGQMSARQPAPPSHRHGCGKVDMLAGRSVPYRLMERKTVHKGRNFTYPKTLPPRPPVAQITSGTRYHGACSTDLRLDTSTNGLKMSTQAHRKIY